MVLLKQQLKRIVGHVVRGLLDGIICKIHVRIMSILIAGVDPIGTYYAAKLVLYTIGILSNFQQTNIFVP